MTTPTIRAALERLVEALDEYDPKWDAFPEDAIAAGKAALDAAQPEGEVAGLTDNQLLSIASDCRALYVADDVDDDNYSEVLAAMRAAIAADRATPPAPLEGEPSDEDLYDLAELFNGDPVPAMRRALELWGRPAHALPLPAPQGGEADADG